MFLTVFLHNIAVVIKPAVEAKFCDYLREMTKLKYNEVNEEITHLVMDRSDAGTIKRAAMAAGMRIRHHEGFALPHPTPHAIDSQTIG